MGKRRENRLHSGKVKAVYERDRSRREFGLHEIQDFFEWKQTQQARSKPPVKILMHAVAGQESVPTERRSASSVVTKSEPGMPLFDKKTEAASRPVTPAVGGGQAPATNPTARPSSRPSHRGPSTKPLAGAKDDTGPAIPMLHPRHGWKTRRWDEQFSYVKMACGFVLTTGVGFLALWLISLIF